MTSPAIEVTTPSDREVRVVRRFNAPRELVFRAWTDSALLKRWYSGAEGWEGWSVTKSEGDHRTGGSYRLEWSGPDGAFMGMTATYREVTPPERLVTIEVFDEAWHPGEAVTTIEFTEPEPGKTTVTMTVLYESREARDIAVATGMTDGMAATYESLDRLLAEIS
jgi:uncharacterized protein YndB with AHSA1/START domain